MLLTSSHLSNSEGSGSDPPPGSYAQGKMAGTIQCAMLLNSIVQGTDAFPAFLPVPYSVSPAMRLMLSKGSPCWLSASRAYLLNVSLVACLRRISSSLSRVLSLWGCLNTAFAHAYVLE